ncbi:glycosyltransferase [Flavobacteriaceae bacterium XHP0103]|uniref:glycosyltransferase n=1 Tax=Marixanthotalea marina TaxID=2844359 RepID=UPI002989EB32|nr:glycosyltransferase [Marixanthotalea marina]MBU3820663.1 glycosyltransferase [Marixanthotalea marina]
MTRIVLTGAIVLYNNDENKLKNAIKSFLDTPINKKLYLIDNSETNKLKNIYQSEEITYIHTGKNLGFGKAHNLVLNEISNKSKYHLVLNPDVYFEKDIIPLLIEHLLNKPETGIIVPKILYPNGEYQHSVRRFPKIYDFFIRRIPLFKNLFEKSFNNLNYLNIINKEPINVQAVSGCFQLFRTDTFIKINGFDTRYFMYMEDIDVCRKVKGINKFVTYVPEVVAYHHSEYGSKKSIKLLLIHFKSIFMYFLKWKFN